MQWAYASCALVLSAAWGSAPPRPDGVAVTGPPVEGRFSHTATLLPNHKVLIAGGMQRNGVWLDTAEIYDPESGRFEAIGKMHARRAGATATLLPDGKVLIAGGTDGTGRNHASAELYDPSTNGFSMTGNLSTPRSHAIAALLSTGKVLVAGGAAFRDGDDQASADLYDPSTAKFTPTGGMHTGRSYYASVPLKDGRVLVMGGLSGGDPPGFKPERSAEIYSPSTGRFTSVGSMATARWKHGAAPLPDGRVLVIGGQDEIGPGHLEPGTEIFDPQAGQFSTGPKMKFHRFKLASGVVSLRDGRILVAGGASQPEIYDPLRSAFAPWEGVSLEGYFFSTATPLDDGRVLVVDGYGSRPADGGVRQAWLMQPSPRAESR
jgi:hypothetical protein